MSLIHMLHSWLNWVDENDEVGLKEKPEDTISIETSKRLHRNKTRSTGVWAKDLINLIPYCHHRDCGHGKVQVRQA